LGQRYCGWVGVLFLPLGVLPGYGMWLLQAPYPLPLGVLARVTLIDSWALLFFFFFFLNFHLTYFVVSKTFHVFSVPRWPLDCKLLAD
jgi:hypothetical protein